MSVQDARSDLGDQLMAEFRQQALQIMQHTCAELTADTDHRTRPSLRSRVGWALAAFGLRLASKPPVRSPRQRARRMTPGKTMG